MTKQMLLISTIFSVLALNTSSASTQGKLNIVNVTSLESPSEMQITRHKTEELNTSCPKKRTGFRNAPNKQNGRARLSLPVSSLEDLSELLKEIPSSTDIDESLIEPNQPKKQARVLCIDGGGLRGIIPSYTATRLEERTGKSVSEMFNMVAGTSTGGLIALGLTQPNEENSSQPKYPASYFLNTYSTQGAEFFDPNWFSFGGVWNPRYNSDIIYNKLQSIYGKALFSSCLIDTIVPAYDVERSAPKIFKSYKASTNQLYNFYNYDVARGTSAAPTYFLPSKAISQPNTHGETREHILIDGGSFANNPTMCTYCEAKKLYPKADEYLIVSLGTGRPQIPLLYEDSQSMKGISWASKFANITLDASSVTVNYQMLTLAAADPKIKYYRFQPTLEENISMMDDSSPTTIRRWIYAAENYVSSKEFSDIVEILSTPKTAKEELI